MKTYVIGDIHGAADPLKQVLERCPITKNDLLITLGDICDGWPFVYECIEELLKYPNRIDIRGNHDDTFVEWLNKGIHPWQWSQGALATAQSYARHSKRDISIMGNVNSGGVTNLSRIEIPDSHIDFFERQHYYYVDIDRNYCFVHGGIPRHYESDQWNLNILMWDRDLWLSALADDTRSDEHKKQYPFKIKEGYDKVFVGHTPTLNWKTDKPMFTDKVINLDTGAGFNGRLTIMDIDTLEYWQSDPVKEFYPDIQGR